MVWVDPRPGVDREPGAVAPAEMRWVHDPFATRPTDPAVGAEAAAVRHKEWTDYLAWFGTLPVSWGADVERTRARVAELVAPHLEHADPPAGTVQIDDVQQFTADGPRDRRAPAWRIPLPEGAPGRRQCEPVWFELSCEGRLLGTLAHQPLGQNGFGYDPIVVPQGMDRTLAELSDEEKNAISHRGRALRRLLQVAIRVYGVPRDSVSTG
ncbi:hypothetical protein GF314_12175 [bacterium]|nr:hypothetical protein [bacterium]